MSREGIVADPATPVPDQGQVDAGAAPGPSGPDGSPNGATTDATSAVAPAVPVRGATDEVDATTARRGVRVLALLVGSVAALVAARPIADNSFLTHLATGRLLVESGLPAENPFLYSSTSFPVPSYWWSIVLGVVDGVAGATGLRLLVALLGGVLGALLVRLSWGGLRPSAGRDGGDAAAQSDLLAVVVPAALTVMCVFQFLSGRPHLLGFVLLAAALVVWQERRSPWWLVPVFAVWVNSHGSWLYGLVVLGLFVVADAVDERAIDRRRVAMLLTAALGTLVGGALYPDRFAIVLLPTRQFGDPVEREALQAYSEWSRVGLGEPMLWMMIGLALLALYGCVRRRRIAMTVVVVVLVAMGMSGLRLVPIAAIALVPFAATGLVGIGTTRLPTGRAARVLSGVGAVLAVATVLYVLLTPNYRLDRFPVAATDWLEERELIGRGQRVLTHDFAGNYLEWRYGDRANAFVDDRPAAPDLLAYASMHRFDDDWRQALGRADPDVIIWHRNGDMAEELEDDPDWVVGTREDQFVVLCSTELADRCT